MRPTSTKRSRAARTRCRWQLHAFVLRLPDRSGRPPACVDAVRPSGRRLHPRSEDPVGGTMKFPRRHALAIALVAGVLGVLAWAALKPVQFASREEVFEIPRGTWARRMSGDKVEILPSQIRLTLGVRDVLLLRNLDDVPQVFGPTIMMPGQSFRLPFEVASSYAFACTAHL